MSPQKQLSIVFGGEITKIRSFEAECIEAHKTTIFSEVSMAALTRGRVYDIIILRKAVAG